MHKEIEFSANILSVRQCKATSKETNFYETTSSFSSLEMLNEKNTNIQSTWSHWKVVWLHVEWLVWGVCRHKVVATNQLFTPAACAALSNRRVTFSIFFFGRESKHYGWSGFNRDTIICPIYIYHHKGNT